ncbi:serine hydrolase domain-containing protein [Thermoanaerobacter indiensis]|uniref:serine hydrolase domain-containing protein n=1 Tax=Thermoanaerobacter indiensis TaxID=1125974 RepID=UPI0003778887|nr:serine hydrolase domain-containing protein [Thermoanaerobacter indiensis]
MTFNPKRLDEAFSLIDRGIEEGVFPCAAVAVGSKEGFLKVDIKGNKRIYPYIEKLNRASLFDLASLTKVVATTMLLMRMVEKGLISVYDRVTEYLPSFNKDGKDKITIFQLITHTSGLPAFFPFYEKCKGYDNAINYICEEINIKEVREVEYSDLNFILLGKILETIGEERLDKLCQKEVFEPLGMKETLFNPEKEDVVPTEKDKDTGEVIYGICHDENARFFGGISGHAGLFSTIDDLIKFANMLVNYGKVENEVFLSYPLFKRMIANYTENLGESRGWGWAIKGNTSAGGDLFSEKAFGHTGFTGTSIWVDPEYGVYIILLTNRVHPTRENAKIIRFRRLFHNAVMASLDWRNY